MRRQNKTKYRTPFYHIRDDEETLFFGRYERQHIIRTDIGSEFTSDTIILETDADIVFKQNDQVKEKHGNNNKPPYTIENADDMIDENNLSARRGNPRITWRLTLS